jgi:chemotaxis signal transduction protein
VLLTFRCGDRRLALPLAGAREILGKTEVVPLPECRPGLRGIIVREGVAVPVVDLPALVGESPAPGDGELVIVEARELRLALVAEDTGTGTGGEEPGEREAPPEGWGFLRGRITVAGRPVWMLDPDRLAGALGAGREPEEES